MSRRIATVAAVCCACVVVCAAVRSVRGQGAFIWVEGEDATRKQVHTNAWFDEVDPDELSGGKWLSSFSEPNQPTGTAEYAVRVPEGGRYRFWLRANSRGTGLLYRVDDGEWVPIDVQAMRNEIAANRSNKEFRPRLVQEASISIDAGWDCRFMAWIDLGELELSAGEHTIAFNLGGDEKEKRFSAIDCFVLTTGEFEPNWRYKPGERADSLIALREADTWAFEPEQDTFAEDSLLDLRSLNEREAGEHGFIRLSPDGNGFVRGDGVRIRFWGGSTYVQRDAFRRGADGTAELAHHARFLAKRGVNIVRYHGALQPKQEGSAITDVDEEAVQQVWRLVAAMKAEGIYTTISPYWGSHTNLLKSWGVPDPANENCSALVFFDATVQKGYKAWLKALYDPVNPHTGIRLADDPAVAIIQLQNEDSMLFYTMQRVRGEQRRTLGRTFGEWLKRKYGSLAKARAAWEGDEHEDDDFGSGVVGLYIVWFFTRAAMEDGQVATAGRARRLSDQLQFLSETMRKFNSDMAEYLRKELGCKQLINAGNWRTVDPVLVDDAERWSYAANEVIGKNHYYGPPHLGFQRGWKIANGHYFCDWSATKRPTSLPCNIKQVAGHPFIIPESLWVPPLRYQSEGPLMVAAQTSLSGVDILYWFATGAPEWQPPGNKWTFATPMQQGQFPAAALMFRKEYVREGEPVVHEERSLQNIWDRKSPIIAEGAAYDPNRDAGDLPADSSVKGGVDPLAFAVGPVWVTYGGDSAKSTVVDLSDYIDAKRQIVKSITGEITWDYGRGIYRVNAPQAQGAAGFLSEAGPIVLDEVTIECRNEYATVVVVALDDRPIRQSGKLLVQVGTVCRPTGWQVRPARFKADDEMVEGFRIVEVGRPPWRVENTAATVGVLNPTLSTAVLLDANGNAVRDVPTRRAAGRLMVELPPEAMYVVLQ